LIGRLIDEICFDKSSSYKKKPANFSWLFYLPSLSLAKSEDCVMAKSD